MTAQLAERPARPPYYRIFELTKRYGVSRATIYRWIADGRFPAPIKLGPNTSAWKASDLEAFETSLEG